MRVQRKEIRRGGWRCCYWQAVARVGDRLRKRRFYEAVHGRDGAREKARAQVREWEALDREIGAESEQTSKETK